MAWYDSPMLQGLSQLTQQQPQVQAPPSLGNMGLLPMQIGGGAPQQQDSITELMNQLYQPQMGMQNRYNELIQNYPQREKPGFWRSLGAGLYGMGQENPLAAADQFRNFHFYQNLGDWQNQAKNLQMAADNERAQNINERQIAYQTAGRSLEERRVKETERKNLETESLKRQTEERRAQSARILDTIRMNPNLQHRVVNGELLLIDPKPGGQGVIPTGYKGLTRQEELEFNANAAMARTMASQQGAMDRTVYSQGAQDERTDRVIAGQAERQEAGSYIPVTIPDPNNPGQTKVVRMNTVTGAIAEFDQPISSATRIGTPSRAGGTATSETQKARGEYQAAMRARNTNPQWQKYITLGPNNTFKVQSPGIFSGPDAATFQAMNEAIYGKKPTGLAPGTSTPFSGGTAPLTVNPPNSQPNTQAQAPIRQRNTRTGQTRVSYDGGKTWRIE